MAIEHLLVEEDYTGYGWCVDEGAIALEDGNPLLLETSAEWSISIEDARYHVSLPDLWRQKVADAVDVS